jgi:hypothetical protein
MKDIAINWPDVGMLALICIPLVAAICIGISRLPKIKKETKDSHD